MQILSMQILFSQVSKGLRGKMAELLRFSQRIAPFLTFFVHVMHFCNLICVCSMESVPFHASMTAFLQALERACVKWVLVCLG
jgi:hypothetical protein